MMPNAGEHEITILPDFIANQIAAGEVVQRPESVVKELVENSLDAGATSIVVIIKGAGKELIHIVDNGKGMSKADILLAPKRHATSKIKTAEDLHNILTLGFRGEALASITSVAQVEIRSRRHADDAGWKLLCVPNAEPELEPCITEAGTQIFVRNLFYNVPARRKFLRSEITEIRYCTDTMLRLALCNPHVRFVYYDNNKLIFDVPISTPDERVARLLGSVAEDLQPVQYSSNGFSVSGYTAKAGAVKGKRSEQFFFLNGRTIQSRNLAHAVKTAYEYLIGEADTPAFCLFLQVDSSRIDVNVHPQKHEVKFDDERLAYNTVREAIIATLQGGHINQQGEQLQNPFSQAPFVRLPAEENDGKEALINRSTGEVVYPKSRAVAQQSAVSKQQDFGFGKKANQSNEGRFPKGQANQFMERPVPPPPRANAPTQEQLSALEILFGKTEAQEKQFPKAAFAINNRIAVLHHAQGILFLDVPAASERIIFDTLVQKQRNADANSQELLFPVRISLSAAEIALVKEMHEQIISTGFLFDTDNEGILIQAVPQQVKNGTEEDVFTSLLADLRQAEITGLTHDIISALSTTIARKSATTYATDLSAAELFAMYQQLRATALPGTSPSGKPTFTVFSTNSIEKLFG